MKKKEIKNLETTQALLVETFTSACSILAAKNEMGMLSKKELRKVFRYLNDLLDSEIALNAKKVSDEKNIFPVKLGITDKKLFY